MGKVRPRYKTESFYPLSKINTGQYTFGNEFVYDEDQTVDYIGLYHILPNNEIWSEASPNKKSELLVRKIFNQSENVRIFNDISNLKSNNYISPVAKTITPSDLDYSFGYMTRFFIQKRTNPLTTITEIDADQFNTLNSNNKPGINSTIYHSCSIKWQLVGKLAGYFNQREIDQTERKFEGIKNKLQNNLEFTK